MDLDYEQQILTAIVAGCGNFNNFRDLYFQKLSFKEERSLKLRSQYLKIFIIYAPTTAPPLGCSTCPAKYEESSEAKKTKLVATSTG